MIQKIIHQTFLGETGENMFTDFPRDKIKIYGYWHTSELNDFIKQSIKQTKLNNSYLEYHIYNEEKARMFIKKNFKEDVVKAYDTLIPKAYKSDLWRYCILYIYGGIYIDLKLILNSIEESFFINNDYHFAINYRSKLPSLNIENSFLYFKHPKSPCLLKAINQIVVNVQNRDKTIHCLLITGPKLLFQCLIGLKPTLQFSARNKPNRKFIYKYNDYNIIDNICNGYYTKNHIVNSHWKLWKSKKNKIFNKI